LKSILLIIPYFGKWPLWFEPFLISVAANPSIHWLCPTDCPIPPKYPENIHFLSTTLAQLNIHVNKVVGAKVPLNPRKFCDLKPTYGEIFEKEVKGYDFWGICDMDIVWGDIRKFVTPQILSTYDIISSRKENISGHFTLFRNNSAINQLYKQLPDYKTLFEVPEFRWTDEVVLSNFLKENNKGKALGINVYWPSILCNQERGHDSHQEYYLDHWIWQNRKMINTKTGEEVMYLHFINWKRTMKYCEVRYWDSPDQFYISYKGMHYMAHSYLIKIWNSFTNVFDGYYMREFIRIQKKKLRRIIKKINKKIFKN
tara:strand:+ start:22649 stop:23587 length:939 start_codon:yes stop_codon:yes gene_type:complete